jgi:signal transduction histidine kinase/CheY-like chemotaxis protein
MTTAVAFALVLIALLGVTLAATRERRTHRRELAGVRTQLRQAADAVAFARAAERAQLDANQHLAASLAEMTRLRELSTRLLEENDLDSILQSALAASIELLGADGGIVQLYEEDDGVLRIAAHRETASAFLDLFESVPQGFSVYGTAMTRCEQMIVEDIATDKRFASLASVYESHDIAALVSTPLMATATRPVGVLSAHFTEPHRPTSGDLHLLNLCARQAARLIEQKRVDDMRTQLLAREQSARISAEQASRLKDQVLATVSHDLRTPLHAILGWADLLRSGELDEARRVHACQAIFDVATRQGRLVDELLDMARIMSGKLRLERSAIDVNEIVRNAYEIVRADADAKNIHIVVDADAPISAFYGDGVRLHQIACNLLTNAVKFTPEGGAVHVRLRRTDHVLELAVTDTGQGIPADALRTVFEPFRQAGAALTRRQGGLGLGLSIVKQLVEAHGGTVFAESAGNGHGSTFTVRLPAVDIGPEPPKTVETTELASPLAPANATGVLEGIAVLVVDDDDENREVVAAYLENQCAVVLTAASAAQALDVLQREQVHVLLTDVAMPDEDGYTLLRKVRALKSSATASIPAVALTAYTREEDRQQALQAGFQVHLTKPIDGRSLIDAVARLRRLSPA